MLQLHKHPVNGYMGDVDEATKDLQRMLPGRTSSRLVTYTRSSQKNRRLKGVPVKICGTNVEAFLDS